MLPLIDQLNTKLKMVAITNQFLDIFTNLYFGNKTGQEIIDLLKKKDLYHYLIRSAESVYAITPHKDKDKWKYYLVGFLHGIGGLLDCDEAGVVICHLRLFNEDFKNDFQLSQEDVDDILMVVNYHRYDIRLIKYCLSDNAMRMLNYLKDVVPCKPYDNEYPVKKNGILLYVQGYSELKNIIKGQLDFFRQDLIEVSGKSILLEIGGGIYKARKIMKRRINDALIAERVCILDTEGVIEPEAVFSILPRVAKDSLRIFLWRCRYLNDSKSYVWTDLQPHISLLYFSQKSLKLLLQNKLNPRLRELKDEESLMPPLLIYQTRNFTLLDLITLLISRCKVGLNGLIYFLENHEFNVKILDVKCGRWTLLVIYSKPNFQQTWKPYWAMEANGRVYAIGQNNAVLEMKKTIPMSIDFTNTNDEFQWDKKVFQVKYDTDERIENMICNNLQKQKFERTLYMSEIIYKGSTVTLSFYRKDTPEYALMTQLAKKTPMYSYPYGDFLMVPSTENGLYVLQDYSTEDANIRDLFKNIPFTLSRRESMTFIFKYKDKQLYLLGVYEGIRYYPHYLIKPMEGVAHPKFHAVNSVNEMLNAMNDRKNYAIVEHYCNDVYMYENFEDFII